MKKKIIFGLLLTSLITLASCGGSTSEESTSGSSSDSTISSSDTSDTTSSSSDITSDSTTDTSTSSGTSEDTSDSTTDITSDSTDDSSDTSVEETYKITLNSLNDSRVVVTPSKVETVEGDVVLVTLTYDQSAIEIVELLANQVQCGIRSDGTYYFEMPAADVVLTLTCKDVVVVNTRNITNGNPDAVDLHGVTDKAEVGSTVTFTYSLHPGYDMREVKVVIPGGFEDVEVETTLVDGAYSFVMPDKDVTIKVLTTYALYPVTKVDTEGVIYTIKANDSTEFIRDGYAHYNDTITVQLQNNNYVNYVGIKVPELYGEQVLTPEEGSNSVSFVMPYKAITIEGVAEDFLRPVTIENSDHITLNLYEKNESGEYVLLENNSARYEEEVYVKVVSTDETRYSVYSLGYVYYEDGSSYEIKRELTTLNSDGYYSFTMPDYDSEKGLILTVVEQDSSKYEGRPFVGDYLSFNFFGSCNKTTFDSSISILSSGKFTKGSGTSHMILEDNQETGKLTLDSGSAAYGENILYGDYNFDADNLFAQDFDVGVKKLNSTDDKSLYTFKYEFFSSKKYAVAEFYREGEPYAELFIDYVQNKYYLSDLEFVKLDGTTYVTDSMAAYDVKVNGVTLYKVRTSGTGGNSNRNVVDDVYGEYKLDGEETASLILDGAGGATLNGEKGTYTYVGNTITVKIALSVYEIEINTETMTYVIVNSEIVIPSNPLALKTYVGQFTNIAQEETYNIKVEFVDETHVKLNIYQYLIYIGDIKDATMLSEQTYSYDESTGVVTVNFYERESNPTLKTLTFTVSSDNSTLTCNEDYNNIYPTKDAVLTVQ